MNEELVLTKEQMLEIVSKTIDRGYKIKLIKHGQLFEEATDNMNDLTGNSKFQIDCASESETSWVNFETKNFEITEFFGHVDKAEVS